MLLQLGEVDDLVHRADILRDIEENSTYITPDLLGDAGERLFALGFTLEQLRRNFEDLKQCAKTMRNQSWAGRGNGPERKRMPIERAAGSFPGARQLPKSRRRAQSPARAAKGFPIPWQMPFRVHQTAP